MIIEILKNTKKLSSLEKEIATFILNHGEEISYLSINFLAKQTYSSNASIIRLCRKCGCNGYKDFKVKYLKELENTYSYLDVNRPFYQSDNTYNILNAMGNLYTQTITSCINSLDVILLEKSSKKLFNANRIFIYAFGDSSIRAKSFANKLFKINKYCIIATDNNEQKGISLNTTKDDIALFVSYRGGNDAMFKCVDILKKNKTPIISITSKVDTYLTLNSLYNINIISKEKSSDNIGTFYSQISFDFILNTLYSLMYSHNYSLNHSIKKNIDENT